MQKSKMAAGDETTECSWKQGEEVQAIRRETTGTEDALVMLRAELTVLTLRQKRYP